MAYQSGGFWQQMPPVTKKIIEINVVVWLVGILLERMNVRLEDWFGLWNWTFMAFVPRAYSFHIWQPLTYMFMHADFWHLFCNMFAVLMFAPAIEQRWGSRRFLTYYLTTGIGAAIVQQLVWMLVSPGAFAVTIGASGAVFGILFAFGWLFPDVKMFLLFVPIPIPARVFVSLYALFELFEGLAPSAGDNVAHFAHLGGFVIGWLLILYWRHKGQVGFDASEFHSPLKEKIKRWWNEHMSRTRERQVEDDPHTGYHYQAPVNNTSATTDSYQARKAQNPEIDILLDKVKKYGYDSLTADEKARLFKR